VIAFFVSVLAGLYAIFLKIAGRIGFPRLQADFIETPLPILTIVMFAISLQFFLMGLLAEMMVRTYHESQDKAIYAVREKIGFNE
jgi:dolichol-phosphate mannosyltransferase